MAEEIIQNQETQNHPVKTEDQEPIPMEQVVNDLYMARIHVDEEPFDKAHFFIVPMPEDGSDPDPTQVIDTTFEARIRTVPKAQAKVSPFLVFEHMVVPNVVAIKGGLMSVPNVNVTRPDTVIKCVDEGYADLIITTGESGMNETITLVKFTDPNISEQVRKVQLEELGDDRSYVYTLCADGFNIYRSGELNPADGNNLDARMVLFNNELAADRAKTYIQASSINWYTDNKTLALACVKTFISPELMTAASIIAALYLTSEWDKLYIKAAPCEPDVLENEDMAKYFIKEEEFEAIFTTAFDQGKVVAALDIEAN